jgi:hypothetical protein
VLLFLATLLTFQRLLDADSSEGPVWEVEAANIQRILTTERLTPIQGRLGVAKVRLSPGKCTRCSILPLRSSPPFDPLRAMIGETVSW